MLPNRATGFAAALVLVLFTISCNNSPTVPLPPPEMITSEVTTPDEEGFVTVSGEKEAVEPDSIVLLFNETAKYGVAEASQPNGAFEVSIEASSGDSLVLQYIIDTEISHARHISVE